MKNLGRRQAAVAAGLLLYAGLCAPLEARTPETISLESESGFLKGLQAILNKALLSRGRASKKSAAKNRQKEELLSAGLPQSLPSGFYAEALLGQEGFVRFDEAPSKIETPLAADVKVTGRKDFSYDQAMALLRGFLKDDSWARLPEGSRIARRWKNPNFEYWDYPVGTTVLHRIRTASGDLFELRIVRKRPDGRWAYGVYVPKGDHLMLTTQQERVFWDVSPTSGRPVRLDITRIHPESCRHCHAMHSPNAYQYPSEELTGPCGFGPANPNLTALWAKEYQALHGYWPFQ